MKHEDFEKAQELKDEIENLKDVAMALEPDAYDEETPVVIYRKIYDNMPSKPVSIPGKLAGKLSAMIWNLVDEKEKEFAAL